MYVVTASHFLFQQASSPFRRVREEEIEVDARVADNSFEAKVGLGGARVVNSWSLEGGVCRAASVCFWGVVLVGASSTRRRVGDWHQLRCERTGVRWVW